jgi:two-component system cell cycle sensor histidine kinase/response regulator CckA
MLAYSGRGRFVVEVVDLTALVEEMARLLAVSVSKSATVEYHFARGLPAVEGDPDQIRQVVMNLIINASEAIGDTNGRIRVTTDTASTSSEYLSSAYFDDSLPAGDYVFVEVADNGCGMDEETKARMFDPFFSTKFTGRGLGLAAVLGIVRGHQGTIHVTTEPGRGTTFRVLFPASARTVDMVRASGSVDSSRGTGTILVVDDDENVRAVAERMLHRAGDEVLTAPDGREGVSMVKMHGSEISAVLLDTTMPNMDGHQAFLEMKSIRPDIRVLVMSGYSEQEVTRRFGDTNLVAGFIQKPGGSTALLAKLAEVMQEDPAA